MTKTNTTSIPFEEYMKIREITKSASLSPCGKYRYTLTRHWKGNNEKANPAIFIMLNPSTADAQKDDPTIRKCMRFAYNFGHTGLIMLNLFAYRAAEPSTLNNLSWAEAIGPQNDEYILEITSNIPNPPICAWGANKLAKKRFLEIKDYLPENLSCLDYTKNKNPKHPLFIAGNTIPKPYIFENKYF